MMLFFVLLSTTTLSAFCLTFQSNHGIRQCQGRCRRIGGCVSVESNANLLCSAGVENSVMPRTECRICKKMVICSGIEKKMLMTVKERPPCADKPENFCAVGSFGKVQRSRAVRPGERSIRIYSNTLKRALTLTAIFSLPNTNFFFWVVDIRYNTYHSSTRRYTVLTSDILKNGKVAHRFSRPVIIEYPKGIKVDGIKFSQKTSVESFKFRLIFIHKRGSQGSAVFVYDMTVKIVKKSSVGCFILNAPGIVSTDNGHLTVNQQFQIYKQNKSRKEVVYIFLRKLEMSSFPQGVIKQINKFKKEI